MLQGAKLTERSALWLAVAGAFTGCTPAPRLGPSYRLVSVDGVAVPAMMLGTDSTSGSQIIWGTLDFRDSTRAIFRWQYRMVRPGQRPDTLGVGVDTLNVRRVGNQVVLSYYSWTTMDSPDSSLVADTAVLRGADLVLVQRFLGDTVRVTKVLRFTPGLQ